MSDKQIWNQTADALIHYTDSQLNRLRDIYKTYKNRKGYLTFEQFKALPVINQIVAAEVMKTPRLKTKAIEIQNNVVARSWSWTHYIQDALTNEPEKILGTLNFLF